MKKNKHSNGFTLIELLVVIAVIGLLASIVLVATGTGRIKGRDARRLADMNQIKSGLELYYDKGNGYPTLAAWVAVQGTGTPLACSGQDTFRVPQDPLNSADATYTYTYATVGAATGGCGGNVHPDYKIDFKTESNTSYGVGGAYCLRPHGITPGACP